MLIKISGQYDLLTKAFGQYDSLKTTFVNKGLSGPRFVKVGLASGGLRFVMAVFEGNDLRGTTV